MFGIDFSEILVIFGIALVVLGPEKLPRLARQIGRWVGRARAMARQFRDQLEQETDTLRRTSGLESAQPRAAEPTPQPRPTASSTATADAIITPATTAPGAPGPETAHQGAAPEPHERR